MQGGLNAWLGERVGHEGRGEGSGGCLVTSHAAGKGPGMGKRAQHGSKEAGSQDRCIKHTSPACNTAAAQGKAQGTAAGRWCRRRPAGARTSAEGGGQPCVCVCRTGGLRGLQSLSALHLYRAFRHYTSTEPFGTTRAGGASTTAQLRGHGEPAMAGKQRASTQCMWVASSAPQRGAAS